MAQVSPSVARPDIHEAARRLFGPDVAIEERAYQALEVITRRWTAGTAAHVWGALAHVFPSLSLVYQRVGSDLNAPLRPWPRRVLRVGQAAQYPYTLDWDGMLRSVFCISDRRRGIDDLTQAGRIVRATQTIDVRSVATSILESARVDADGGLLTNFVLRHLARGAGYKHVRRWTPEIRELSESAIAAFDVIYRMDESAGQQQFILLHDGSAVRIRPFASFGAYSFREPSLADSSLWVARGNVIQPPTRFTIAATEVLEELINSDAPESQFQSFFETYPEFLLALGNYQRIHPQVVLQASDAGPLIPDFFLEKLDSNFCDVCDLKRPTAELVRRQRNRERFRSVVMEAIAQLTTYRDWFEDSSHRDRFHSAYGLQAYRPRVALVIGRRRSYVDEIERIRLESQLPGWLQLTTYDDVLGRARQWRSLMTE